MIHWVSTMLVSVMLVDAHRWKANKAEVEAGYVRELTEAKAIHQQHVVRIRRQWEKEQKVC